MKDGPGNIWIYRRLLNDLEIYVGGSDPRGRIKRKTIQSWLSSDRAALHVLVFSRQTLMVVLVCIHNSCYGKCSP